MHNQSNSSVAPAEAAGHGLATPVARRSFLRYTGASLAVGGLLLAGCSDDDDNVDPNSNFTDVGSGDIGILNYAYALEQLEAAFYAQVVAGGSGTFFAGASAGEKAILTDIRDHEAIHAAFFKTALGSSALPARVPDFSGIDFNVRTAAAGASKMGVLDAAKAFEDLGVAAYNGAGRFITDVNNLVLAGKIVSVEARHAAAIRELIATNTFVNSEVVDVATTGKEKSKRPPEVLETANKFLAADSRLRAPSFA